MRNKKLNNVMFLVVLVQTFSASAIPSIIGMILVYFNAIAIVWGIARILAFILATAASWFLWMRFRVRYDNTTKFYLYCGTAYLIYAAVSITGIYWMGYVVYSLIFANLRLFESQYINTLQSIIIVNIFMCIVMVVCERFSARHVRIIRDVMRVNGADAIEMEEKKTEGPTQNNKKVEALSDEQLEALELQDQQEAIETMRKLSETLPEKVIDSNMTKGKGEEVEFAEFLDIDNDITEGDFGSKNYYENYSDSDLWNADAYQGRDIENKPDKIMDFSDEITMNVENASADYDADSLWSNVRKGRGYEAVERLDVPEEFNEDNFVGNDAEDYDPGNLWGNVQKGRGYEKVERLDITQEFLEEPERESTSAAYDSDNLWNDVQKGRGDEPVEWFNVPEEFNDENMVNNPNEDYEFDSLWNMDAFKDRLMGVDEEDEI